MVQQERNVGVFIVFRCVCPFVKGRSGESRRCVGTCEPSKRQIKEKNNRSERKKDKVAEKRIGVCLRSGHRLG